MIAFPVDDLQRAARERAVEHVLHPHHVPRRRHDAVRQLRRPSLRGRLLLLRQRQGRAQCAQLVLQVGHFVRMPRRLEGLRRCAVRARGDRAATIVTAALAALPIMIGAIVPHAGNGFTFSNTGGGWEYPVFWTIALAVQAMLGDGAYAIGNPLKQKD